MLAPFLFAFGALASSAETVLQPQDHASPSGEWVLHVDPSRRDGGGPGEHRMMRGGEEVWRETLPVTLWHVAVTGDGRVVGCAYANGFGDWATHDSPLHIVVLDAAGEVVTDDAVERRSRSPGGAPSPWVLDLVVQEALDRARIRVYADGSNDTWWTFGLTDGERRADWTPRRPEDVELSALESPNFAHRSVVALPGTPLLLVHWEFRNGGRSEGVPNRGVAFELVDAAGKNVWTQARPLEHTVPGDEEATTALSDENRFRSPILATSTSGRFSLWSPKKEQRADYAAQREGDAWVVERVGTAPQQYPVAPRPVRPTAKPIELRSLAEAPLRRASGPSDSPLDGLERIAPRSEGELEVLRRTSNGIVVARFAADDEILATRTLAGTEGSIRSTWFPARDGTWFHVRRIDGAERVEIGRVDPWTGAQERLAELPVVGVEEVRSTPEGGFVLLGERASGVKGVFAIDAAGAVRWHTRVGSSERVAVTTEGFVVLVEAWDDRLRVLDADGARVRDIDLLAVLGGDWIYPRLVGDDGSGGVWIEQDEQLWRLTLEGEVLAQIEPRVADGRRPDLGTLAVADDGTLWFHDDEMVAASSPGGEPGRVLGRAPSSTTLEDPDAGWIDRQGRVLIRDERSGSWHVFDAEGEPLFVCALPPDVEHDSFLRPTVDASGVIHVPVTDDDEYARHFAFDAPRGRVDEADFGTDEVEFEENGAAWRIGGDGRFLDRFEPDGRRHVERIVRRSDGRWWHLRSIHRSACGERLVVVDIAPSNLWALRSVQPRRDDNALVVFDGDGENAKQFALPHALPGPVTTSADRAALGGASGVLLVDLRDGRLLRAERASDGPAHWNFSPDGAELWCVDVAALTLHRFALPE